MHALVVAVVLLATVAATATPAAAEPPIAVDFTVLETLPLGSPGDLVGSDVPGCAPVDDSVTTSAVTVADTGPATQFRGTKVVDCGGGDMFTLTFRATASECSSTDEGTWKLVDGTGIFAGAKGHGTLLGTYTLGDGDGTFCENDGISDHYTGKIKLAS